MRDRTDRAGLPEHDNKDRNGDGELGIRVLGQEAGTGRN
jgi:hypothetical protein